MKTFERQACLETYIHIYIYRLYTKMNLFGFLDVMCELDLYRHSQQPPDRSLFRHGVAALRAAPTERVAGPRLGCLPRSA